MARFPLSAPEKLTEYHDLAPFACGEPAIDDWLRRRAWTNQASGSSQTFVLCEEGQIVGYYSLAAGAVTLSDAPDRIMPDSLPVTVLGPLAVLRSRQGTGIGRLLLRDAVLRTQRSADIIGIRALLVHALSPPAKRFYEHYGFQESPFGPMTLMLMLKDVSGGRGESSS